MQGGTEVTRKVFSIVLGLVLALSVGLVACGGGEQQEEEEEGTYGLTVVASVGGSVIRPGEGTFAYAEGTEVTLEAMADEGYQFHAWTGDVATIANVEDPATTVTVNGHYTIIAGFAQTAPEALTIYDWYDLAAIEDGLAGHYVLMNDLDSNTAGYIELASPTANGGLGWHPIGTGVPGVWEPDTPYLPVAPFVGSLDGQGFEIRDLSINRPGEADVGLFSCTGYEGAIKNVGLPSAAVTGGSRVGSLVGVSKGAVANAFAGGHVNGEESIDGTSMTVGGLIGFNYGSVVSAYFIGDVTGDGCVGGLVGVNGALTDISRCYSGGSVIGKSYVGGLVGCHYGTANESYCTGDVIGWDAVGGLLGRSFGIVSDCYSIASVTRSEYAGSWLGGFVGYIDSGVITKCYSAGSVSYANAADPTNKGFAGSVNITGDYEMTHNFWDTQTSGQVATAGDATGKTTAQMQSIAAFSGEAWSITAVASPSTRNVSYIWNIVDGQTYPFLSWQSV
jgi:hypothetical protein